MKSHFLKENDVVLSSRWQFQDGRSKGMGTEWDQEVVGTQQKQYCNKLKILKMVHIKEKKKKRGEALESGEFRICSVV